jgi:hypothetical protein
MEPMNTPPGRYSVNRLIEWSYAAWMLGNMLITVLTYGQKQDGAFAQLATLGFGDLGVIIVFGSIGAVRAAALYANGKWKPYGAYLRMTGSLVGALMWGNLFGALTWIYVSQGTLYRGAIVTYLCATVFEIISCHRAANDSRVGRL